MYLKSYYRFKCRHNLDVLFLENNIARSETKLKKRSNHLIPRRSATVAEKRTGKTVTIVVRNQKFPNTRPNNFWFLITIVTVLPVLFSATVADLLGIRWLLIF